MAILLGRIGGTIERGKDGAEIDSIASPEIPRGIAVDVDRTTSRRDGRRVRDDRRQCQHRRRARVVLPSIGLTGYGGWESDDLSKLIMQNTDVWQAGLSVFQTIFAPGRTQRQVDLAWGQYRETLANYIGSVQTAFADVEDALVARRSNVLIRAAEDREVASRDAARRLAQIATTRASLRTSKCWMRSASCSRPSFCRRRLAAASWPRPCSCSRRWAAAGRRSSRTRRAIAWPARLRNRRARSSSAPRPTPVRTDVARPRCTSSAPGRSRWSSPHRARRRRTWCGTDRWRAPSTSAPAAPSG